MTSDGANDPGPTDSAALFRRYSSFVASFLYRLGVRGAELEDLVQDVFLTVHRRGGYRPGPASPTTFLARIALEARLASRRRSSRFRSTQSSDAAFATVGSPPQDPSQVLADKRAAFRLEAALAAMDPGHRTVFILFELHGETCEAIAAGLDVKVGTVYSRLHAARRDFRAAAARCTAGDGKDDADGEDEGTPVLAQRSTA